MGVEMAELKYSLPGIRHSQLATYRSGRWYWNVATESCGEISAHTAVQSRHRLHICMCPSTKEHYSGSGTHFAACYMSSAANCLDCGVLNIACGIFMHSKHKTGKNSFPNTAIRDMVPRRRSHNLRRLLSSTRKVAEQV